MKESREEELMNFYNSKLQEAEAQTNVSNLSNAQSQMQMPEPDTNLIREQLDLGPELKRIDYLLRSYELVDGQWRQPADKNLVILSSYGVQIIREFLSWYVNKNTLLSNYEEETILDKMRDASHTLNELIFRNYEKIFLEPTFEDCREELMKRLTKKAEVKKFMKEMVGQSANLEDLKKELLMTVEDNIEIELAKIKKELMNYKMKRFSFILRVVQDTIHSTYNRAWNGQERRSLRQHMQITETKGSFSQPPPEKETGGIRKLLSR